MRLFAHYATCFGASKKKRDRTISHKAAFVRPSLHYWTGRQVISIISSKTARNGLIIPQKWTLDLPDASTKHFPHFLQLCPVLPPPPLPQPPALMPSNFRLMVLKSAKENKIGIKQSRVCRGKVEDMHPVSAENLISVNYWTAIAWQQELRCCF